MKTSSRKTRHKLKLNNDTNSHYIGIASTEPDYRICILINDKLGFNLKSSVPLVKNIRDKEIAFSRFSSSSDYTEINFDLISNYSGNNILMSKLSSIDYIIRINGMNDINYLKELNSRLREINEITGVFTLDEKKHLDKQVILTIS